MEEGTLNRKKILVITSSYPLFSGDINGQFIHELAKRLAKNFDISVLAPYQKGSAKSEYMEGVSVFRHPQFLWPVDFAYGGGLMPKIQKNPILIFVLPFFLMFQVWWIRKICNSRQIKVIHAQWLIPAGLSAVLYKVIFNQKIKIIASSLGSDYWGFKAGWRKTLLKFILNRIDELVTVSNAIKTDIQKNNLYQKPISSITMGVDTKLFVPGTSAPGVKNLLFVGRLISTKGIDILISAMPAILKAHGNVHLNVIGSGPLKETLIEKVSLAGLQAKINFPGFVKTEKLPEYFARADIFILPSLSEGWPVVVMEAMSAGCVPVVTDIPVFEEYKNQQDLFLVTETGNQKSLETALINLLKNSDLEQIKTRARNYAVSNFDWEIISSKYSSVYNNTLAQTKSL